MKEYQAAMLLAYPRVGRIAEHLGQLIEAKAAASYRGRERTEECVEQILRYLRAKDCLLACGAAVDEVLEGLTREERFLLEYKYFRRQEKLAAEFGGFGLPCSERQYYRMQRRLERKAGELFMRAGYTEAWFLRLFADLPYMMRLLDSVRQGKKDMIDLRHRGSPIRRAKQGQSM